MSMAARIAIAGAGRPSAPRVPPFPPGAQRPGAIACAGPTPGPDGAGPGLAPAGGGTSPDDDLPWFEPLFRKHYATLRSFAFRLLGSLDAAEDVVQDTFMALWRTRARWRAAGAPPRAYLYRAVHNRAVDQLRGERVRALADAPAVLGAIGPRVVAWDQELEHIEAVAAVERAIEVLPERCRVAFRLSRGQGLSYREIAQLMDISPRTVEGLVGRALRLLRSALASPAAVFAGCIAARLALL